MEFVPGQVVRLVGGGPRMSVSALHDGEVFCHWFVGDTLYSQRFDPDVLESAETTAQQANTQMFRNGKARL